MDFRQEIKSVVATVGILGCAAFIAATTVAGGLDGIKLVEIAHENGIDSGTNFENVLVPVVLSAAGLFVSSKGAMVPYLGYLMK